MVMTEKNESVGLKFYEWAKEYAKANPIVVVSFVSTSSGGLILFWYCLIVGKLPEFSLSDVAGMFIAAFLMGLLVVGALSFTYIVPAALARYILDHRLPEQPDYSHVWNRRTRQVELAKPAFEKMRAEFFSLPFLLVMLASTILVYSVALPTSLPEFIWQGDPDLVRVISWVALISVIPLVIWGDDLHAHIRGQLRLLVTFCFVLLATLYAAHRLGVDATYHLFSLPVSDRASTQVAQYESVRNFFRSNIYSLIALLAALATWLAVRLTRAIDRSRQINDVNAGPPRYPKSKPSMCGTRFWVVFAFVFCSAFPLVTAMYIAEENGPAHEVRALGFTIAYLALFNLVYFKAVNMRRQLRFAWLGAILVFVVTNQIASQSLTVVPKATVSVLELGNFHVSSVTMSAEQCSALALYGVECEAKKDSAITLMNANVLNRMGTTATLELQVKRDMLEAPTAQIKEKPAIQTAGSGAGETSSVVTLHVKEDASDYKVTDSGRHWVDARKCDEAQASWLKAPWIAGPARTAAQEKYRQMWCVRLDIPKTQLLSYSRDDVRNYRGGYTVFEKVKPVPAKT